MERNIRSKIDNYINDFKNNLQTWINENNAEICINGIDKQNEFLQYMLDFPNLELEKQDFQKRKRVKNNVPDYNRCIALKCNSERCSRKQKHENTNFCGTHMKGSPYGTIQQKPVELTTEKLQLLLQDINGISRYIDNDGNIYCTEDIMNSSSNPRIIGKYILSENNEYSIVLN